MKIVHFVEAYGGGVYTYVTDLIIFLNNHSEIFDRDDIHLVYSDKRVEFDVERFKNEIPNNVNLHLIPMKRSISLWDDFSALLKTRQILKKINPDIIHLHSSKASVIGRIASFGIIKRNKIYYSPHGYAFVEDKISSLKKNFYILIEKSMQFFWGGITVASGDTEYKISKTIGESILIRNGISFLPSSITVQTKSTSQFTVGTVGRLLPQKNPALFNEIALKMPYIDFVWIGNGELSHLITAPNIRVTGWIKTRQDLLNLINSFDLYLQTSLWEGLPISILEAMALRKPVVATNVIGNKDTVDDGKNGYLFDSEEEAVEKLNILYNNIELKNKMGESSYEKCRELFNKERNFNNLLHHYLS